MNKVRYSNKDVAAIIGTVLGTLAVAALLMLAVYGAIGFVVDVAGGRL